MTYTAATTLPISVKFFQWARPDAPNPHLTAPFESTSSTIQWSSIPLDHTGTKITGNFFVGIRRASDGFVTNVYVPAAAVSSDGYSATGVIRVRLEGLDYTTADDVNDAVTHNQDDVVFCNISPVMADIMLAALSGTVGLDATGKIKYASAPTFSDNEELITKRYADALAIAGAPNASTAVKGIVEEATQAEVDARTAAGGTAARLFVNPTTVRCLRHHDFAADGGATDAYAITVSPTISAYTDGDVFTFEAATVNTGNATLNVNAVGAKNLLKYGNVTLADGDIKAGTIVQAVYDADSDTFMLLTPVANPQLSQGNKEIYAASATGNDTYVVTYAPVPAAYVTGGIYTFQADVANTGACSLNVNALGAKTIKKFANGTAVDLSTGDIAAGGMVICQYNGTDMILTSAAQPRPLYSTGQTSRASATGTGTQNIAHGLGCVPRLFEIYFTGSYTAANNGITFGSGNASAAGNETCSYTPIASAGTIGTIGQSATKILHVENSAATVGFEADVSAMDATNVTLDFTTNTGGGTVYIQWRAYA